MSIPEEDPECKFAYDLQHSIFFESMEVFHSICSIIGIVLLVNALNTDYKRHQDWNIDKIVTYITATAMIVHNLATTLIVVISTIKHFQAKTTCDLTITTSSCLYLRIPTITAIIIVSLASFAVVCSHSVQLVSNCNGPCRWYENIMGVSFIVIASAVISTYIFYEEDPDEIKSYCIAESSHNRNKMMVMYKGLAIVDVTCAILCFALAAATRHKLQSNAHNFKLNTHFELQSNARVLKTNLIKCLVRIFIFDTFLFLNFVIRIVVDRTTNRLGYTEWVNANYNIQLYAILYAILIQYDKKIVTHSKRVIDTSMHADHHHREMMKAWLSDGKHTGRAV